MPSVLSNILYQPIASSNAPVNSEAVSYSLVGSHVYEEMALRARKRGDVAAEKLALQSLYHLQLIQRKTKFQRFAPSLWAQDPTQLYPDKKPGAAEVYTFTANHDTNLPGTLVISDDQNPDQVTTDVDAIRVHQSSKQDYMTFLRDYYSSDSMDGHGIDHYHTVHYGDKYNNAFMDGKQMAYGDGDGVIFNTFALPKVGIHENSHLRTQEVAGSARKIAPTNSIWGRISSWGASLLYNINDALGGLFEAEAGPVYGGLIYRGQSGALNEHFSDFDAIFVYLSQIKDGVKVQELSREDWLLGAGLMVNNRPDGTIAALRSFLNEAAYDDPNIGKDSQPKHMKDYYNGSRDSYGVHINSGIFNHAAYKIAVNLGTGLDVDVKTVVGIQTAIWDEALKNMHNRTTFKEAADLFVAAAQKLFSADARIAYAVQKGFEDVGVLGAGAIEVDQVIDVSDDLEARELNIPAVEYRKAKTIVQDLEQHLHSIPGFSRVEVGARIVDGRVALVPLVFVTDYNEDSDYPRSVNGIEIVIREELPIQIGDDDIIPPLPGALPVPKNVKYNQ